ncbi:DUF5720 family protein [Christensenellaceae bacterium OttesenSCG-928-L17]|nr:DUF5720 family protein [Christensenellaceae bacterium OttesenSCG-928-L17]
MDFNTPHMGGHSLVTALRYADTTRHMIEFEVRSEHCPYGTVGSRMRLFLTEDGYTEALERQNCKQIKIRHHACVIEGNLVYDRKKNKSRRRRHKP